MESSTWELITQIAIVVTGIATAYAGIIATLKWRSKTTPKDKLVFSDIIVRQLIENNQLVPRIRIGFALRNLATFSIELEIKEIRTELENLHPYPLPDTNRKRIFKVFPENTFLFWDNFIDLSNSPRTNQTLRGRIYVNLKYGYPGKRTQDLEIENLVSVTFDENGNFSVSESFEVF